MRTYWLIDDKSRPGKESQRLDRDPIRVLGRSWNMNEGWGRVVIKIAFKKSE